LRDVSFNQNESVQIEKVFAFAQSGKKCGLALEVDANKEMLLEGSG
jgi:hypothetical protein